MPRLSPGSTVSSQREAILAVIHSQTDCFLDLARRETKAAARGDWEYAELLHIQVQRILDRRGDLIREFAKPYSQAS